MANTKITDLPTKQSVADSDYLIVDDGNTTYKAEKSKIAGSSLPHSFVGMVVQGTNLTTEASVKAIYGNDTSWSLLSSVALTSENVFGNGKGLGLANGVSLGALNGSNDGNDYIRAGVIGSDVGSTSLTLNYGAKVLGVPTKTQLGANPEYSGIIVDTIAVYMWERTA